MSYSCMIGCKTCNFAPEDVWFYKKESVLAIIFHKQLLESDADREVRVRLDDKNNALSDFFEEHQNHHLVYIDSEGIHEPSIDDLPVTAVTYSRSRMN